MLDPDWQRTHASKLTSAEDAVRRIRAGRRILIGSGAAEPVTLVETMVAKGDHLRDNEIVHLLTLGPAPYVAPDMSHRFRHTAFFIGPNVRDAVNEGRADFIPVFLSEIPLLIRARRVRIDVALIQVSPPDRHGYVSLGVSVDVVRAAVDTAALVIAEVNPRMPRTPGDSFVHVSKLSALVAVDSPLLERNAEPSGTCEQEIGRHVASLIPNGATLQTGIGRIPDAVLAALANHCDLGVHTEMLSDGVMALVEAGVVNGRQKTLLPSKLVTSFIMGSKKLYEWADENPAVEMRPSDFTNDPLQIARNASMIAINSALAVDLTGQVASDTLEGRFFSGIGGQVDFIRGAARSVGGKAIIALPATAKKGSVSRIQPVLEAGTGVVTSRGDVRYVVTEYGIADLWGKTIRERALALIGIAHPDHRGELMAAAKQRRFVYAEQRIPRATYPWQEAQTHRLADGTEVAVRPLRSTDTESLQRLLYSLSNDSIYRRFFSYKRTHSRSEMDELVDLDYEANMGLVVTLPSSGDEAIGLSRYDVEPATGLGDIAFVVRDDWQGRGLGTLLLQRMIEIARARGLAGFQADVLAQNRAMLGVFYHSGLPIQGKLEGGVYHLTARFAK